MAVSEVSIINDALIELGEPTIIARTDDTAQAKVMDKVFDQAKEELLEEAKWRFASKYQELAQEATGPDFKYDFIYQLPGDYVRLIEINETDIDNVIVPLFEIVDTALYTNETSVKIVFVRNVDASLLSPLAARALSFKLGAKTARTLTDSASQKQEMLEGYDKSLKKAKASDSMGQRQPIENRAAYSQFLLAQGGRAFPQVNVEASDL